VGPRHVRPKALRNSQVQRDARQGHHRRGLNPQKRGPTRLDLVLSPGFSSSPVLDMTNSFSSSSSNNLRSASPDGFGGSGARLDVWGVRDTSMRVLGGAARLAIAWAEARG
jgi:hypothetical protein